MGYQECYKETNELAAERYELVAERIAEIAEAAQAPEPFAEYFRTNATYLQSLRALYEKGKSGSLAARSMEECEADNEALYGEILPEAYGHSYANPAYAAARLGETFGGALSLLAAHLRTACGEVFRGNLMQLTIAMELFVEVYNCFEGAAADALPQEKEVQQILYWYFHDYREIFDERSVRRLVNPAEDFEKEIVMQADLSDLRYLYRYGAYIGENERQIAAYLNTLPEADIQAMADTYTEGYRIGFDTTGKDLSKKTAAQVRYPIGFERMVRAAVCNFEKMGLEVTMLASGTAANKQYDYDHREDRAYYLDKAYVERGLETWKNAFEEEKVHANGMAGPAVIEVFGEEPFSPETKKEAFRYGENSTENNSQSYNDASENTENENAGNENADESLDTESMAVYDYMSAAGILSAGDAGIIRNGSTAKGTFYSVFETGEADGNTYENRLVYDRVSENGQCDLFVYEQLVSGSDTRLLGFYAVNKTTNEVFSADRNSWGGVSSREYQDATGEN